MSISIPSQSTSTGPWAIESPQSKYLLYPPEPRNGLDTWLQSIGSAVSRAVQSTVNPVGNLMQNPSFDDLLQKQMALQVQMQLFSAQSNISRTEHEIQMTTLRNMRLG
jgi:hypothetical protein